MRTKENSSIPKEELFEYLFEEPFIMMLYSINPYLVADELAELETKEDGLLNFI